MQFTLYPSCFLTSLLGDNVKLRYRLISQTFSVQARELSRVDFSDATLLLRYLDQAKSHSFSSPSETAVQYVSYFRFTSTLKLWRIKVKDLFKRVKIWLLHSVSKTIRTVQELKTYCFIYYKCSNYFAHITYGLELMRSGSDSSIHEENRLAACLLHCLLPMLQDQETNLLLSLVSKWLSFSRGTNPSLLEMGSSSSNMYL